MLDDKDIEMERKFARDRNHRPRFAPGQEHSGGRFGSLDDKEDEISKPSSNPFDNLGKFSGVMSAPKDSNSFLGGNVRVPSGFNNAGETETPTFNRGGIPNRFDRPRPGGMDRMGRMGMNPQPANEKEEWETKVMKMAGSSLKKFWQSFGIFSELIKASDVVNWSHFGGQLVIYGGILSGVNLVFSFFMPSILVLFGINMLLVFSGLVLITLFYDKAQKIRAERMEQQTPTPNYPNPSSFDEPSRALEDDVEDMFEDEVEEDETEEWVEEKELEGADDFLDQLLKKEENQIRVGSKDTQLNNSVEQLINMNSPELLTRGMLFGYFKDLFTVHTSNFARMEDLGEENIQRLEYQSILRKLVRNNFISGLEDIEIEFSGVSSGFMIDIITIERPREFKGNANTVVNHLREALEIELATKENKLVRNPNIKVTHIVRNAEWLLVVKKDVDGLITVGDALKLPVCSQLFTDGDWNTLPIIVGYDLAGNAVYTDLRQNESMLVAGLPRSGKSWFLKNILGQLLIFNSPKDINFMFIDPKDRNSDFYSLKDTLYCRGFGSTLSEAIEMMNYLIKVEGKRRSDLFYKHKAQNYWQYKEMSIPNKESVPLIYLVLEEMISIVGDEATQEEKSRYRELLNMLVTKMPSLGIRLLGVPHSLKNDILPKTAIDNIGFKAFVNAEESEIANVFNLNKKAFPYALNKKGEAILKGAAVRNSSLATDIKEAIYVRGLALNVSDQKMELMWQKVNEFWKKAYKDQENEVYGNKGLMTFEEYKNQVQNKSEQGTVEKVGNLEKPKQQQIVNEIKRVEKEPKVEEEDVWAIFDDIFEEEQVDKPTTSKPKMNDIDKWLN